MAVGRVDDDGICSRIHQGLHTVERIIGYTHTGCHTETAFLILTGHRLILGLGDILIGNQSYQTVVLIHHRQFFDFVFLQDLGGSRQICLLVGRHQIVLRHDFLHRTVQPALEAQVSVGHDTHETLLVIHHGNTAYMILRHNIQGLCHGRSEGNGHGIIDHAIFCTLHDSHLTGLVLDGHILMDHTDASLTGDGNSHLRLRDRIHGSRHEGDIQLNVPGETGFQLNSLGKYLRISRN